MKLSLSILLLAAVLLSCSFDAEAREHHEHQAHIPEHHGHHEHHENRVHLPEQEEVRTLRGSKPTQRKAVKKATNISNSRAGAKKITPSLAKAKGGLSSQAIAKQASPDLLNKVETAGPAKAAVPSPKAASVKPKLISKLEKKANKQALKTQLQASKAQVQVGGAQAANAASQPKKLRNKGASQKKLFQNIAKLKEAKLARMEAKTNAAKQAALLNKTQLNAAGAKPVVAAAPGTSGAAKIAAPVKVVETPTVVASDVSVVAPAKVVAPATVVAPSSVVAPASGATVVAAAPVTL